MSEGKRRQTSIFRTDFGRENRVMYHGMEAINLQEVKKAVKALKMGKQQVKIKLKVA